MKDYEPGADSSVLTVTASPCLTAMDSCFPVMPRLVDIRFGSDEPESVDESESHSPEPGEEGDS